MSCHCCLTLADCCVASCHAAAYHPPVPVPLLILVADAPLSWSLFHIVVSSSARDPLRPFQNPPRLQTADWWGKGIAESCRGGDCHHRCCPRRVCILPPPPRTLSLSSSSASWLWGEGWLPGGGGAIQPPVIAAFLAYVVVIVLPPRRLSLRCLLCCAPAGLPALPPPSCTTRIIG
jgi:hypothetical protein